MALTYILENVVENENKTATFLLLKLSNGEKIKVLLEPKDFIGVATAADAKAAIKAKIATALQGKDIFNQIVTALKGYIGKEVS